MYERKSTLNFALLGDCEDKWPNICPILAGSGYCNSDCLLGSWTQAGCKKSCGTCPPRGGSN